MPATSLNTLPSQSTLHTFLQSQKKLPSKLHVKKNNTLLVRKIRPTLLQKIWDVVTSILNVALGIFLYWTNSSMFAFSFIIGIIRDDDVEKAIKKIKDVWDSQPFNTCILGGVGSVLGGVGTFLSLPVTIAVGSILYAANLGCTMSRKAQEILKSKNSKSQSH